MPDLKFEGAVLNLAPGQTVLAALEAAGVPVESSCRAGACQTCVLQLIEGEVPAVAQAGLSAAAKAQGLFMSCVCTPEGPLTVAPAGAARSRVEAEITALERLSDSVVRLRLAPQAPFPRRPGQFLNLIAEDGLIRSYSIAGAADDHLELHVRLYPDGRMSRRIAGARLGERLTLAGPQGGCIYDGVEPNQTLILAGTGTGLAPLWGVLNEALERGHTGPIRLYHGALTARGLYLVDELRALEAAHANFSYRPCLKDEAGDLVEAVKAAETDVANAAAFLCGDAELVGRLKRALFLAGARLDRIRMDAFLPAAA